MKKEGRKNQGRSNNKAKQHSTHKVVTFPKKNELPEVGLELPTLHSRQSVQPHVRFTESEVKQYTYMYLLCSHVYLHAAAEVSPLGRRQRGREVIRVQRAGERGGDRARVHHIQQPGVRRGGGKLGPGVRFQRSCVSECGN